MGGMGWDHTPKTFTTTRASVVLINVSNSHSFCCICRKRKIFCKTMRKTMMKNSPIQMSFRYGVMVGRMD